MINSSCQMSSNSPSNAAVTCIDAIVDVPLCMLNAFDTHACDDDGNQIRDEPGFLILVILVGCGPRTSRGE